MVEMLDKITEACHFLLNNYPGAQSSKDYLNSRLGKLNQEKFQFGYFPGIENISVLIDLVGKDTLHKSGLLYIREIEDSLFPRKIIISYFENYPLIMPYRNTYGKVVGLVGRSLLNDEERDKIKISKYKNTKETRHFKKGNLLFGLYENKSFILEQDRVYIVEGQFDVIKAGEVGLKNIVALGNSSMTSYQFSLISRYSNNIFLLLDNDVAGQKGRKLIVNKFGHLANIRDFYVPDDYKDIDEYITKGQIGNSTDLSFVVKV